MRNLLLICLIAVVTSYSFVPKSSRALFLRDSLAIVGSITLATTSPPPSFAAESITHPSGVHINIISSGSGPKPEVGELAAIRFKATHSNGIVLDDILDTPEPFYTRVGSGSLIKGVEKVLPDMRVGDHWILLVPGELAFGKKGRSSSAGKPRVPPDAVSSEASGKLGERRAAPTY